jgi:hypothetical protein
MFPARIASDLHGKRDYHNAKLKEYCERHGILLADICAKLVGSKNSAELQVPVGIALGAGCRQSYSGHLTGQERPAMLKVWPPMFCSGELWVSSSNLGSFCW